MLGGPRRDRRRQPGRRQQGLGGRQISVPSGVDVCGRGFYAGGQYFLPLSSGGAMADRSGVGQGAATVKFSAALPGNLVGYRGRVISQGPMVWNCITRSRPRGRKRPAAWPPIPTTSTALAPRRVVPGCRQADEAIADFRRALPRTRRRPTAAPAVAPRRPACRAPHDSAAHGPWPAKSSRSRRLGATADLFPHDGGRFSS